MLRSSLILMLAFGLIVPAQVGADIVSPNHEWITADDVKACHAAGIEVHPWTANDDEAWSRLLEMKVDGIITDDPAGLIAFLQRRAAPSRPGRR